MNLKDQARSSDAAKGSIVPKPSLEAHEKEPSPKHISPKVPVTISSSATTAIAASNAKSQIKTSDAKLESQEHLSGENKRFAKLESLINESPSFEIEELRKLAWSGVSSKARAKAWKILCGYLPPPGTAAIR